MGFPRECVIRYHRQDGQLRLTLRNVTNHETREVLVGLWSRMDHADRIDHLRELVHYLEPDAWLSPVAQAIKDGPDGKSTIDVNKRRQEEHKQ